MSWRNGWKSGGWSAKDWKGWKEAWSKDTQPDSPSWRHEEADFRNQPAPLEVSPMSAVGRGTPPKELKARLASLRGVKSWMADSRDAKYVDEQIETITTRLESGKTLTERLKEMRDKVDFEEERVQRNMAHVAKAAESLEAARAKLERARQSLLELEQEEAVSKPIGDKKDDEKDQHMAQILTHVLATASSADGVVQLTPEMLATMSVVLGFRARSGDSSGSDDKMAKDAEMQFVTPVASRGAGEVMDPFRKAQKSTTGIRSDPYGVSPHPLEEAK